MDGFTPNTPADCPECGGDGKVEVLGDYLPGSSRTPYDDATEELCDVCGGDGVVGYDFTDEGLEWLRRHTTPASLRVAETLARYIYDFANAEEALKRGANGRGSVESRNALATAILALRNAKQEDPLALALRLLEARAEFLEDADADAYGREAAVLRDSVRRIREAAGLSRMVDHADRMSGALFGSGR